MATTSATVTSATGSPGAGQAAPVDALPAARRLTSDHDVPIIAGARGYVWDENGNRYLDGLSALFCVNAGHGRDGDGEAAARQIEELDSSRTGATPTRARSSWRRGSPRWPRATSTASSSPRRLGGGGVGDQARPRLPPRAGNPPKTSSSPARSPTTAPRWGARGDGHSGLRHEFEPLVPGGFQCRTRTATGGRPIATRCGRPTRSRRRSYEGPDTVAAVILEPLQNAGGCIPPQEGYFQRVREICDRHDVLLISDEVICSWGRLGYWFGCERYGYQPDIITTPRRSPPPTCRWAG